MSEDTLNTIAIWILLPSFALMTLVVGATALGTPRGVRARLRQRQLGELEQREAECRSRQREFEIDWVRFREIPKTEIISALSKRGWAYRGQEITDEAWLLKFALGPAEAHGKAAETNSRQRLAAELASAEPDVQGRYQLDTSQYADLSRAELRAAIEKAGWTINDFHSASAGQVLVLSRPGEVALRELDGSFMRGVSPEQLRRSPAVVDRAAQIKRSRGIDPLSPKQMNWARERHKHWQKRFNRQSLLAFFYGVFSLLLLLGALFSDLDSSSRRVVLAVGIVLLALFALAVVKAVQARRKRRAEIGAFLDAYEEISELAEDEQSQHPRQ